MSGGSTDQPVQTTTTKISPEAQQLFNLAYPGLANFAANPPKRYQGETVAGFTPTQQEAQQQILGGAGTAGAVADWSKTGVMGVPGTIAGNTAELTPFAPGPALTTSTDIFNDPGIWNPQYNMGLTQAIEAAQRPTWQGLTEQALPAIRTAAGPVSGTSRQGIAEGLATGRATQSAADIARKMVEDEYNANLAAVNQRYGTNIAAEGQRYGQDVAAEQARYGTNVAAKDKYVGDLLAAYGMAPSLQQQSLVPGFATGAVGDVQQQLQQAILTGDINAWNYDQWAPFLASSDIMSLIQGLPGATTVSTGNVPKPNPATQAVGSALSGAAVGGAVGGVPGAVVGGAGGAILPFLFNRA